MIQNLLLSVDSQTLLPASLILIDRTLDIFTPSLHPSDSSLSPLLHKIFSSLNRQVGHRQKDVTSSFQSIVHDNVSTFKLLDIDITCPNAIPLYPEGDSDESSITMSGISSLPVQITPSIGRIFDSKVENVTDKTIDQLWRSFISMSEDVSRIQLCGVIRQAILKENGSLPPPKKRGFGAELLVLVQALVTSSGSDKESIPSGITSKFNVGVCRKYMSLLAFAFAIIDSLQRSSSKQFKQAYPSRIGCYEDRSSLEKHFYSQVYSTYQTESLASILQGDLDNRIIGKLCTLDSSNNQIGISEPFDILQYLLSVSR